MTLAMALIVCFTQTCSIPTISSVLGRAPGFCSRLPLLSGLHLASLFLQIGRPGNIIPRARIWQRSPNAKRKPQGFNDAPEKSHLFFSANLWHLAMGLMSCEQAQSPTCTVEVSSQVFPNVPKQRVPPAGCKWSLFCSPRYCWAVDTPMPPFHVLLSKYALTHPEGKLRLPEC